MVYPTPAAATEVTAPNSTTSSVEAALHRAYNSSSNLKSAIHSDHSNISPIDWLVIRSELAFELAKYPNLNALLIELRTTEEADKILQAVIYLRAKAGLVTRRNSIYPAYQHSLRIADSALRVSHGLITENHHLATLAIKGILHDTIEDFDKEHGYKNIKGIFGNAIARCVWLVTMPEKVVLAKFYPDISAKYIPHILLSELTTEHMNALKKDDFETYSRFGAELKAAFKHRRALGHPTSRHEGKGFRLDELIIKGPDNTDSLRSDVDDINNRAIILFKSDEIRAKLPEDATKGKAYISTAQARHHMQNRIQYHQDAITVQFNRLIDRAGNSTKAKLVQQIGDRINGEFWKAVDEFELLVIAAERTGFSAAAEGIKPSL